MEQAAANIEREFHLLYQKYYEKRVEHHQLCIEGDQLTDRLEVCNRKIVASGSECEKLFKQVQDKLEQWKAQSAPK